MYVLNVSKIYRCSDLFEQPIYNAYHTCMYVLMNKINMYVLSYGCFENSAHHHLGLGEISSAEQDEVVKNVVEVVDRLAQLEALWRGRGRWPALVVPGVEAGRVGPEQMSHGNVHLAVAVLHTYIHTYRTYSGKIITRYRKETIDR